MRSRTHQRLLLEIARKLPRPKQDRLYLQLMLVDATCRDLYESAALKKAVCVYENSGDGPKSFKEELEFIGRCAGWKVSEILNDLGIVGPQIHPEKLASARACINLAKQL